MQKINKKIRVLYLINSLKNGGPVNMLYTLVKYIDKNEFDVHVLALNPCTGGNARDFSSLNCEVTVLNETSIRKLLLAAQRVVDTWKPQIIHSHGGVADTVSTKLKGQFVSFNTIHCDPDEDFVMRKGKILGRIKANAFFYTLKKIEKPIACSETVANKILKKRGVYVDYIRNGIDLNRLNTNEIFNRSEFSLKDEDIVLVFCGYLSKRKNVSFLINAIKNTNKKNIHLLVVGDGDEYDVIKQLAGDDERIHLIGRVESPTAYLMISNFFISASLSEGLPLAVMEGMGCGLPAILSNIESHSEIKKCCDDGVLLFGLSNDDCLVKILNEITVSSSAGKAAQRTIYENLNASRMAKEYQNSYRNSI